MPRETPPQKNSVPAPEKWPTLLARLRRRPVPPPPAPPAIPVRPPLRSTLAMEFYRAEETPPPRHGPPSEPC